MSTEGWWVVGGAAFLFVWFWNSLENKLVSIIKLLQALDHRLHDIEKNTSREPDDY